MGKYEKLTNENYAELAEAAMAQLKKEKEADRRKRLVSTSKIRNLLSMISDIYNELLNRPEEKLDERTRERIAYLRVRFVYEAGREDTVKHFVKTANILEYIQAINGKRSEFILFSRYMEALVAYFKYFDLDEKER